MIFTIPLCLRVSEHGWPAPDVSVRDWFKGDPPTGVDADKFFHKHFIVFLTALVKSALGKLQSLSEGSQDRETLLSSWHAFFEDDGKGRDKFYQDVTSAAQTLEQKPNAGEVSVDYLTSMEAPVAEGQDRTRREEAKFEPLLKPLIERLLYPELEALVDFITKLRPKDGKSNPNIDPLIVVVFDEANTLHGRFWHLQRVLSILDAVYGDRGKNNSFWSVFMATNSYVPHFTPTASECMSQLYSSSASLTITQPTL